MWYRSSRADPQGNKPSTEESPDDYGTDHDPQGSIFQVLSVGQARIQDFGDTMQVHDMTVQVVERNLTRAIVVEKGKSVKVDRWGDSKWYPTEVSVWNLKTMRVEANIVAGKKWRKAVEMLKPFLIAE